MVRVFLTVCCVSIGLIVGLFSMPHHASAAWPINTPEDQTRPMWAGDAAVWNDNRLGSIDIFIRAADGVIKPLISSAGDQTLFAASPKSLIYTEKHGQNEQLVKYDLTSHALTPIAQSTRFTSASIFGSDIAWSDGVSVFWQKNGTILSLAAPGAIPVLSQNMLAWIEGSSIHVWNGVSLTDIVCLACRAVVPYHNQFAYLDSLGVISSYPSPEELSRADPTNLISDGNIVLYWVQGQARVSDGRQAPNLSVESQSISLGTSGILYENAGDVNVLPFEKPPAVPAQVPVVEQPVPRVVSDPQVTVVDQDTIRLQWKTDQKATARVTFTPVIDHDVAEVVTRNVNTLAASHTLTTNGLQPGMIYICRIEVINAQGSTSAWSKQVGTWSLLDPRIPVNSSTELVSGKQGIWDGQILAAPGVIDDTTAVVRIGDSIKLLDWTIGLPPPLHALDTIRLVGQVNKAGTSILMHRASAVVVQSGSRSDPDIHEITAESELNRNQFGWVHLNGTLESATKTRWIVSYGSNRQVRVEWLHMPSGVFKKGIQVELVGFLYDDGDQEVIAATTLLSRSDSEVDATSQKSAKITSSVTLASSIEDSVPVSTIRTTETVFISDDGMSADKQALAWYNSILSSVGVLIYAIFFIPRRH